MILRPITLIDCLVFCVFLAPQLLIHAGIFRTVAVAVKALPVLLLQLPYQFLSQRYRTPIALQPQFVRSSTVFEDFVIRCVRYGFSNIPAGVGRVFFSKGVSLPFIRWRMLRHGYLRSPVRWKEVELGNVSYLTSLESTRSSEDRHLPLQGATKLRGVWLKHHPDTEPDLVLYYVHGGGFAMGSCYFYLEFLMVWLHLLVEAGYKNPAIFAVDYTLVPDDAYPRQVLQVIEGYEHALRALQDASKVCVAGDSAGGCLVLSLLLELGAKHQNQKQRDVLPELRGDLAGPNMPSLGLPQMAVLISPWVTLMSNLHYPSRVDFLERQTLWIYAHAYAGDSMLQQAPASPGSCNDGRLWRASRPSRGYYVVYGEEEVLAPDIAGFVKQQAALGIEIKAQQIEGGVHAWPVASMFLSSTEEKRLEGLRGMVKEIRKRCV